MITLYHAPRARSSRFIRLLEELGAPSRLDLTSIKRGAGEKFPAADRFQGSTVAPFLGRAQAKDEG